CVVFAGGTGAPPIVLASVFSGVSRFCVWWVGVKIYPNTLGYGWVTGTPGRAQRERKVQIVRAN
ncbi:unnamed protein product, partial [marine sediment metagenome]